MKICGIIVEYNPFHNGHRYHAEMAREQTGADIVIFDHIFKKVAQVAAPRGKIH